MIVKILSSAGSFSGVEYNENKVSLGTAEPLAEENFGLLELNGSVRSRAVHEYQQFFKAWSTTERGMIDKPQFHAVISCEGREYSGLELKAIAEQYLEKMGYKNNPYLIYFHKDTANNHVHIVSSRVDESGRKINDSFERHRSQAAIKKIIGKGLGQQFVEQVTKSLCYNFSSEAQFKMLLESQGLTVTVKAEDYQFIRGGQVQHSISKTQVDDKIKNYVEPTDRSRQLKALFIKYKPALTPEKFSEFMQSKFGVEIVFHTGKGKNIPYGYTIIDHAKEQVFKGSQVMPLAALLTLPTRQDQLKAGAEVIDTLANEENNKGLRYREVKAQLLKLGFELNSNGVVRIWGEKETSFSVSKERMKQLLYNDRLFEAQKFTTTTPDEVEVICKAMFLRKEDAKVLSQLISGEKNKHGEQTMILSDKLNSLLATGKDLGDIAKENKYSFARKANTVYLIDQKNHTLYNMAQLMSTAPDYSTVEVFDCNRINQIQHSPQLEYSSGTFAEVAGLVLEVLKDNPEEYPEKKRKRKRKD